MSGTRASTRAEQRRAAFRRTSDPIDPRNRLIALLLVFLIVGAGFVALLVDLQTMRPDRYRGLGQDQRIRVRQIAGYRGAIVDRNGFVFAASTPSHQIVADPTKVEDPAATAALLAPILGIDATVLTEQLTPSSPNDRYALLARHVDDTAVAQVEEVSSVKAWADDMAAIWVRPEENRVYPAGDLATPLVGRVDPDEQGIFGVEKVYNDLMTGVPGTERFERGRFGSISVGGWEVDPARAGFDVVLTIDHRIQYMAEQTLIEHCRLTGAKGATAVMGDPRTGEILAMASVVRSGDDCVVPAYNPALVDTFEPGSVIKPLVVAAVTEELGLTADTLVDVPTRLRVGDKSFSDHPQHPAAPYSVSHILAKSMNVGTILISQQVAAEILYDYLVSFGITGGSGLDFPGESTGALRHPDDWWGADYGSIPIGQGMTVNATQLLSAYNVLANGGTFVAPTLIRSIDTKDGVIHSGEVTAPRRVISPSTAAELTRSLAAVVEGGTGATAAVPGYVVAGKTGTAWKAFDDGEGISYGSNGNRRYVVSFVGYLPAEDPRLSMVVMVDEPQTEITASAVAAPIFSEIAGYAARILPVPPTVAVADGERVRGVPAAAPAAPDDGAVGGHAGAGDDSEAAAGPPADRPVDGAPAGDSGVGGGSTPAGSDAAVGTRTGPDP